MNLDYFKNPNLKTLFDILKEKYYKTSKLVGTVKITPKTKEEVTEIEKLLRNGKYLKNNEESLIKILDIRKGIEKSKYYNYSLEVILEHLYGTIKPKKIIKEEKKQIDNENYNNFINKYKDSSIESLLFNIPKNEIIQNINKDYILFTNVCNALLKIPDFPVLLSVFSTTISKDPHYFDLETKASNLLIKYLSILKGINMPKTRIEKINLLKKCNIITDAYSNFVITYNLWGEDYLDILASRQEPVLLNINNIVNLKKLYTKNKKIIILENPSVLDYITKIDTEYGIIIGGGNPNAALYELLDKFSDHTFLYNGDYDPEGLLIADKLSKKYKDLKLILYSEKLFEKAKSNKGISDARIKILDNLTNIELMKIGTLIKSTRSIGYQEEIIDDLIRYIKEK